MFSVGSIQLSLYYVKKIKMTIFLSFVCAVVVWFIINILLKIALDNPELFATIMSYLVCVVIFWIIFCFFYFVCFN